MKFNEPVRPAGIGRKQVAFSMPDLPSSLTIVEQQDNEEINNIEENGAVLAQAVQSARVIAYSAASSAIDNNMNEVWGIKRVQSWEHTIPSSHIGTSYIKWISDPRDETYGIVTSLAYVDTEDPTVIRVRKKGWYLVNIIFTQTEFNHNGSIYYLRAMPVDQPDSFYTMQDICISDTYPVLRLSTLIGIPGQNSLGKQNSTGDTHFDGGIQIQFTNNSPNISPQTFTLDDDNVEAQLQIIWLRPFEDENTYNFA
jgi:hypothetical protein